MAAKTRTDDSLWWRQTLACPRCRQALADVARCDACGLVFEQDDGTPKLFDPQASREVTFRFDAGRSWMSDEAMLKMLRDPPLGDGSESNDRPYHFDLAHAHAAVGLGRSKSEPLAVLEIGCGGGQARKWFQSHGFRYVGTDIHKSRVFEWLQKHGGPDLLCDAHFLPFKDAQFDLVYAAAVTEHLACPFLVAQEVARVLKPGGTWLGNVSFLEPWHDNSYFHMTPLGAIELLTQAKFNPEYVWPGRGYSAFHSMGAMGLRRGLKPLKFPIRWIYPAYRAEAKLADVARRMLNKRIKPDILWRARIAGAVDWIAKKT